MITIPIYRGHKICPLKFLKGVGKVKKFKNLLIVMSAIGGLTMAACGGAAEAQEPAPEPQQQVQAPEDDAQQYDDTAADDDANPLIALVEEHFDAADLGGQTLRFHGFPLELDPYSENPFYAQQGQERRAFVEERFNITLEFIDFGRQGVDWNDVPGHVVSSVAAGDPAVHLFAGMNAAYWLPPLSVQNALIPDTTGFIQNNFPNSWWQYHSQNQGNTYGFRDAPLYTWFILAYNRDLINQVGMELTPQEMFVNGNWSLEEFYEYLFELNALLPAGVTPLGMHPTNWQRGAAFANGGYFKNPSTHAPGYLEENFLEPARMMQQLIQSGLHLQPVFLSVEDGGAAPDGHWSFGGAMGDTIQMFLNGELAMTFLNTWNFGDAASAFEFGVVPFPWGSFVEFSPSGDWRDLKTHNQGMYANASQDASTITIVQGSPDWLTHEMAANIFFSFNWEAAERLVDAREREAQGLPEHVVPWNTDMLFTELDQEMFAWYASGPIWEPLDSSGTPTAFFLAWFNSLGSGADLLPAFQAIIGEDVWAMYQAGHILLENVPDAVRAQAEEFGAIWLQQQEEEENGDD